MSSALTQSVKPSEGTHHARLKMVHLSRRERQLSMESLETQLSPLNTCQNAENILCDCVHVLNTNVKFELWSNKKQV